MSNTTLYKKDSTGKIRVWEVEIDYDAGCLNITHGVLGGELVEKQESIEEGKAGRDIDEQLELRANSRINKKLDNGYVRSIEETALPVTNTLGLLRPMKAQPTVDKNLKLKQKLIQKIVWSTARLQRKYNGHRCLIKNTGRGLVAYSRGGKAIDSITHILDDMEIPLNATVDGELYCHGVSLQTIGSWVRRKQEDTQRLVFVAYDMISPEPFAKRYETLCGLSLGEYSRIAQTYEVSNMEDVVAYFHQFRKDGYEGAILRHGPKGYEDDKRSDSLLKIKSWSDEEFIVHEISESRDGWAVLHMLAKNGIEFKASAPGTFADKIEVLKNKDEYIGFSVTVRYAELTDDGVPSQPVAVAWRAKGE